MKIIGHRGAKGTAPENTIAGLRAALHHNVDGVEFDVRTTSDSIAVLHHDPAVEAADGSEYMISHHILADLQAKVPELCTLNAALRSINRRAVAYIEVKEHCDTAVVASVLRKLLVEGWQPADFVFLSFDYRLLKQLHQELPDIPLIINESWSSIRAVWRARQVGTKNIDIGSKALWYGVIKNLARHGYRVYTYALNDPDKAQRWQLAGLYGVITDHPDKMHHLQDHMTRPSDLHNVPEMHKDFTVDHVVHPRQKD